MQFHLDRRLSLKTKPEHKSLYRWAINEIDDKGHQIGHDQIPWHWSLHFTATSCELGENFGIRTNALKGDATPETTEITQSQVIRAKLRPGIVRDDQNFQRQTSFSMFGTDRSITSFELRIHLAAESGELEKCTAWGSVSYTSEVDFRSETEDDCVWFFLAVKPERFAQFAAKVANGSINELILSVGLVEGFYSEWSPSVSTRRVKVLVQGSEHLIASPLGEQFEPPRLGHIGETELHINRRIEFGGQMRSVVVEANSECAAELESVPVSIQNAQLLQALESVRRGIWIIAWLLAMACIFVIAKRWG